MLKISNLSKKFQSKDAVKNISFNVEEGDFLAIIGQNGSGKSTTIKMIMGELLPSSGDILFNDKKIKIDDFNFKKNIFYIPQEPIFYSYLSAYEYINWIADVYKVKNYEDELTNLLKLFDLFKDKDRLLLEYSQGMIKKTVLIAALISNASIMILDEVFAGLDPVAIYHFKKLLKEYVSKGNTIIFVSHILESLEKLCNKIIMMKDGNILEILDRKMIDSVIEKYSSLEEYYIKKQK